MNATAALDLRPLEHCVAGAWRASARALAVAGRAAAALLVLAAAEPLAAFDLDRGPLLQHVTSDGVTVVWETRVSASGHVRYGLGATLDQRSADSAPGTHHEVRLEGLSPGASYRYALYEGDAAQSPVYAFFTDAGPRTAFRFVVVGDNRSDHAAHQRVVEAAIAEPDVAFVLNTGDMVGDGEVEADWTTFLGIERELLAGRALYPTIGNHEEDGGEVSIYERLFAPPTAASGSERYYAFTYGNSRFLVLDGHVAVDPWYSCLLRGHWYDCFSEEQESFVEEQLTAVAADPEIEHIFVATHVGPYSSKEGRTGSAQMRALLPSFLEHGVDIVLSGHDHYYEHGRSGNGIDYVVTGGGGAPLYQIATDFMNSLYPHEPILSLAVHHYLLIEVDGATVQVTTVSADGDVLERFEVGARATCLQASECAAQTPGACSGAWDCAGGFCQWVCDPPPSCTTAADCPAPPADGCAGEWRCALGRCDWVCQAECASDDDCAAHTPLTDCAGGRFQCMDEVCEWLCPPPPDAGAGVDAAAAPDVSAADLCWNDAAGTEAGRPDRATGGQDTGAAPADAAARSDRPAVGPGGDGAASDAAGGAAGDPAAAGCGGCRQQRVAVGGVNALPIAALLAAALRLRRRRTDRRRARDR